MTLSESKKKLLISFSVVFLVLFIDQFVKIWIKTHYYLGESYEVFGQSWFQLHFIENRGMAFGMEFAGNYGKIILSVLRIALIGVIAWYIVTLVRKNAGNFLIITISLVFAGAIGNVIDSAFYGLIFSESTPFDMAVLFPDAGGYGTFLHGQVVDMFYFPLFTVHLPSWIPFAGGKMFTFFDAIFNVADATITVGVFILLIFQKRLFKKEMVSVSDQNNTDQQPQGK